MSTTAIQLAFQLAKHPQEMNWLLLNDTPLPTGITDLLRLCSSNKRLQKFSNSINVNSITIRKILLNFIEKVLLNDSNSATKILGLEENFDPEMLKIHYQLLMRIFHPDLNTSSEASHKMSLLSKAYKELKETTAETPAEQQQFKNIKLSRTPPKSFYYATQKAEKHHSSLKNTFVIFAGMGLVSLGIIISYLFNAQKQELIASPQQTVIAENIPSTHLDSDHFNIEKANFSVTQKAETNKTILQMMLRDIETYYENGNVQRIKPIIENTPEMRNQSDEEIQSKLERLFEITHERKMMLYDFQWKNISGKIRGVGKFISRYKMINQMDWQIREGTAIVTAEDSNDSFSVTGLKLENNIIE